MNNHKSSNLCKLVIGEYTFNSSLRCTEIVYSHVSEGIVLIILVYVYRGQMMMS
jgi:hypothetical protein